MIFTSPILNMYASVIANRFFSSGGSFSFTIFPGSQPSGASIAGSWSTYSALYLQHWRSAQFDQPNPETLGLGNFVECIILPASTAAYRSGTATWGIFWPANHTEAVIQGASLPSSYFIVGPVTDISGTGMIKLASTTITALATSQPSSATIAVNFL